MPSGVTQADKPMIAINNFQNTPNYGHIYVAGTGFISGTPGTFATLSTDGGVNWSAAQLLSSNGHGAEVVVASDGIVYIFCIVRTFISSGPPSVYQITLKYTWRKPADTAWATPVTIAAHPDSQDLYSTKSNGGGHPKRSNSATAEDYFVSNANPRAAVNPVNGRIYMVYADLPFAGSSTDRGDIFINEGVPQPDGSLSWTGVRKVNNDATSTDQWNPSIAINPLGTQLFVGYYSRQEDPTNNALIKAYEAKANVENGLATATFDVFPISVVAFPPLFAGTVESTPPQNTWMYDPVWPQVDVCLDDFAVVAACPAFIQTQATYQHFMADDYTWASSDGSFFYYAWCDRSDTYFLGRNSRADPNIRLGRIKP